MLGAARSTFEKRYRSISGVSAAQAIREVRLDQARKLLSNTRKTIDQIARAIGFSDPRPFVVFFKREAGMTPGKFRRKRRS